MFIKYLERIQMIVGVISLSIFFLAILFQVIARYMGIPVIWTEELANYSFIWAVFMGAAVMVNKRDHFRFDLVVNKLKGKAKLSLEIFNELVILAFNGAIFYYGIIAVQNFWDYTWTSVQWMKMGYIWISVPIMGFTMVIYSLAHIGKFIKQFSVKEVSE